MSLHVLPILLYVCVSIASFREELDELTVKQLKEVLMLNRVDFKGCCEKSELLERVQRLWDDLQSCPGMTDRIFRLNFKSKQKKLTKNYFVFLFTQPSISWQRWICVKFVWMQQLSVFYWNAGIWQHARIAAKC